MQQIIRFGFKTQVVEYYSRFKGINPYQTLGTDVQIVLMDSFGCPATNLVEAAMQLVEAIADMDMLFSDEVIIRYWWQVIFQPLFLAILCH